MHLLILGGTRFLGLNFLKTILNSGNRITLFNRGSMQEVNLFKDIQIIKGDRNRKSDVEVLQNKLFDVVVDFSGYTRYQIELMVHQLSGKIGHYIYCSSGAVYEETEKFPLTEDQKIGNWPIWGEYGRGKLESELYLWDTFLKSGFPLTIIRPVFILGPDNYLDREKFIISRILNNSPILLPGGGQSISQFVFVDEVSKAIVNLLKEPFKHIGEVYNCCGDEFITLFGLVELFATKLKKDVNIIDINLKRYQIADIPYEAEDIFPFSNSHFICSNEKLRKAIGCKFRSLDTGIEDLINSYTKQPLPLELYPREKKILENLIVR
jgi:dTDP-glucose 4,6-dehydratase